MIQMVTGNDPPSMLSISFIDYILKKVNAMAKKREYCLADSSLWTKLRGYPGALKECFYRLPRRNYEVQ